MPLLAYQQAVASDPSRTIAFAKSRRIGGSHAAAVRSARRLLGVEVTPNGVQLVEPSDQLLLSASEDQARELLGLVRQQAEALAPTIALLDSRRVVDDTGSGKQLLATQCGSTARAFACSPRSVRGFSGDVVLDELAFVGDQEALMRAVRPCADPNLKRPKGFTIFVVTSAFGRGTLAHRLCEGDGSKADAFRRWSRYRVTIEDAVAMGFPDPSLPDDARARWLDSMREEIGDPIAWAQEYLADWSASDESYIPAGMLLEALYEPSELPRGAVVGGADIGRRHDAFALCPATRDDDGVIWLHNPTVLRGAEFREQERTILSFVQSTETKRVLVDEGGMGSPVAEALERQTYGTVRGFTFTGASKADLVEGFKLALSRGLIRIPAGATGLIRDLASIRRIVTDHGNISYRAPRDTRGHADAASAALLAFEAVRMTRTGGGPGIWTTRDFDPGWQPGPAAQMRSMNAGIERKDFDDPADYYRAQRNPPRGISRRVRRHY